MNVHAAALAQSYPFDEQTSAFAGDVIGDLSQFPETPVAEIFLRRRRLGAVRADHGAAGILPDPHRARHSAQPRRRDRFHHSQGGRAGGVRRRRHHQGPPAAGALRFRRLRPGRHFRRLPERAGRAPCARIFPSSASIRLPPISPRRLPCRPRSKGCPRSASFRDRRSAISSRMKRAAFLRSAREILGRRRADDHRRRPREERAGALRRL